MAHSPHDALFRFTFGQPEHAAALLREVLPATLVRGIDWSTLRLQSGTQIDPKLRRQQSDLLFLARAGARQVWLYLLIEHKSRNEPWAVLQLLGYVIGIWQRARRQRPRPRRLPLVVPVVLHCGRRPWTAAVEIAELLDTGGLPRELTAALHAVQPRFRHFVVSLADRDPEQVRGMGLTLLGKVSLAALQFLPGASHEQVVRAVVGWADVVRQLLQAPSGLEALAALSTYLWSTTSAETEPLLEVVERVVGEGEEIMKTAADRLRAEGKALGKAEGLAQGEVAGRAALLARLLVARFGPLDAAMRARLEGASPAAIDEWAVRCLSASSLAEVFSRA